MSSTCRPLLNLMDDVADEPFLAHIHRKIAEPFSMPRHWRVRAYRS